MVILACAEHFAEGLVQTGEALGVDPFILVQWVAPLASEAPELIVACLFAWRLKASDSLGTLLSSKVNQWTLLVGTIPIVFAISAGTFDGLPLDTQQRIELLLTAAQSLFAVSLLVTLALTTRGAAALFVLFAVQFFGSLLLSTETDHVAQHGAVRGLRRSGRGAVRAPPPRARAGCPRRTVGRRSTTSSAPRSGWSPQSRIRGGEPCAAPRTRLRRR